MKKVTDSYIKEHIKNAANQITPKRAVQIWEKPVEKAVGDEWYLDGLREVHSSQKKIIKVMACAAVCFVICLMSGYLFSLRPDATIYLDVNPSIELQVNRKEKIFSVKANNQDGETVLDGMELKNTDLDVAVNAVLGSMVRHGYLSEAKNMILLSVDSSNTERADDLRKRISEEIHACLEALTGTGIVLDQNVEADDEVKACAQKYGITLGKAYLLKKLMSAYPDLDYEKLAGLSMKDMVDYLTDQKVEIKDYVNYSETVSKKKPDAGEEEEKDSEESGEGDDEEEKDGEVTDEEAEADKEASDEEMEADKEAPDAEEKEEKEAPDAEEKEDKENSNAAEAAEKNEGREAPIKSPAKTLAKTPAAQNGTNSTAQERPKQENSIAAPTPAENGGEAEEDRDDDVSQMPPAAEADDAEYEAGDREDGEDD